MRLVDRIPVLLLILCSLVPADASAQGRYWKRFYVAASGGSNGSDVARGIEANLSAEQWDDTAPQFFGPATPHPFSVPGSMGELTLRAGFRFHRFVSVELLHAEDDLGFASGYRGNENGFGTYLQFSPRVETTALLGTVHLDSPTTRFDLRAGGGIASYDIGMSTNGGGGDSRIGVIAAGSIGLRVWRLRFFVERQQRFVGDVTYGPYQIDDAFDDDVHTFGEYDADLDHGTTQFGLGVLF